MALEVSGTIHKIFDTEQKTDTFKAREFVIQTPGEYPQYVKFQIVQDKCSLLDNYNEGQEIKVHFDLRGREWQGKYFTNLNAWKIDAAGSGNTAPPPAEDFNQDAKPSDTTNIDAREDLDDLPF